VGLAAAAPFLVWRSARNWAAVQVRRLRNPRYLIATAVGAFYLWTVLFRRLFASGLSRPPALQGSWLVLVEAALIAMGMVMVLGGWVIPGRGAAPRFSQAEIHFFFAGPCSRRQVLHYKLLRTVGAAALSSAITALFFGRSLAASPAYLAIGFFFGFASVSLHLAGAALTREALSEHGRFGLLQRLATAAVALAFVGGLVAWALSRPLPPLPRELAAEPWVAYVREVLDSWPLRILLFPFRAPVRVMLARSGFEFLRALPGALAVLAANYAWAASSDRAFEEASLAASEDRARRMGALRAGRLPVRVSERGRRTWPKLAPAGRPELALAWKVVTTARRTANVALVPLLLGLGVPIAVVAYSIVRAQATGWGLGLAAICAGLAAVVAVIGPSVLRMDLRQDLANADLLRALPMSGRQIVEGELFGAAAVLAAAQWALWLLALASCAPYEVPGFPLSARIAVAAAAALLGPAVSSAALVVHNAGILALPGWFSSEVASTRGVEAMGQRLLTFAGGMLALAFGLAPAAAVGGVVFVLLGSWAGLGLYALPPAALAAVAVVGAEIWAALHGMGWLFEHLDITE